MSASVPADADSPMTLADHEIESGEPSMLEQRLSIMRSVLRGDIEGTLNELGEHFPDVLAQDGGMIRLKLRCHQFVELVNAAAEAIRASSSPATLITSLSPSNASSTSVSAAASLSAAESRRLTYQVLTPPPLRPTPRRQQLAATQTPRPTPRGIRRLQGRTLLQAPLKSQGTIEAAPLSHDLSGILPPLPRAGHIVLVIVRAPSPLPPLAMDVDNDAPTQAALKSALEYGCGMRIEYRADAAERPEVQALLERTWSVIVWPFSPRWV
ncbi:hypothetical protein EDB84DRAFT_341039 [Lactarius hengduanensis]|nr:hypothetical protein EDB84DRAFT_341039 [Lactarius hengduanensis]